MGIIIRQSIWNTLISYVGIVLGFVSTILLFPNFLTQDQYGLTRVLISLSLVCAQFAHLGVNNVVIRFFPYFKYSEEEKSKFLSFILVVPLVGFILFSVVYILLKDLFVHAYDDQSKLFRQYFLYLLPLVFSSLFFEVLNNYIRALQDSITGSFVNEVLMRGLIIILLIAYYFELLSFSHFMVCFVTIYCIRPAYLLTYLYTRWELSLTVPKLGKKLKFLKGMGVYGAYSLLGGLATLLLGNIDIIMLGGMTDLQSTAVYAIAFYAGSVIAVPQSSITKIAMPLLSDMIKEKKFDKVESLYQRTSLNQIIAGCLLYVGIWANMHNLLDLLPPDYQGVKWIIIVVAAAKFINMATGINGGIIMNSKHYRFDLYTNIMLILLSVGTNYIFILKFGMLGAAIATAISVLIYNFVKYIFVWIKFSMQPFRWNSLAIIAIAGGCLLISMQIPYLYNFIIDLFVRSFVITFLYIGSILWFDLSEDTRHMVIEGKQRIKSYLIN